MKKPQPELPKNLRVSEPRISRGERRQQYGRNRPCPCGSGKKLKKCCSRPKRPERRRVAEAKKALHSAVAAIPDKKSRIIRPGQLWKPGDK